MLGLPDDVTACLFDLDGVLTGTAELHRAAWKETFDMLKEAVAEYPDSFELRYDYAMAAERVNRLDVLFEALCRQMPQ